MQKTRVVKKSDIKREWYIIDLKDQVLGRAAVEIAKILTGKYKPLSASNTDTGDNVVVINASKVVVTGRKTTDKVYYRHSGYLGGLTETNFEKYIEKNPEFVIRNAVKGMLPKNKLQSPRLARMFVFKDETHDKSAQMPKEFKLRK